MNGKITIRLSPKNAFEIIYCIIGGVTLSGKLVTTGRWKVDLKSWLVSCICQLHPNFPHVNLFYLILHRKFNQPDKTIKLSYPPVAAVFATSTLLQKLTLFVLLQSSVEEDSVQQKMTSEQLP